MKQPEPKYERIELAGQQIDGYLGHWLDDAIDRELMGFPLEDYLWAYHAGGVSNGRWSPDEFVGKYLHALTFAYDYKYRKNTWSYRMVKSRMDAILASWIQFQKEDGYLFVGMQLDSGRWEESNTVWMSKYVLLGLLKHYELFGYPPALETAERLARNFMQYYGPDGKELKPIDAVMLESMVLLYRLTGEPAYKASCDWIVESYVQPNFVDELLERSGHMDRLPQPHAYTMVSILISLLDYYQAVDPNPDYLRACETAVEDMVDNRQYITGGFSQKEHFKDAGNLSGYDPDNPQEACAVAHFIYLCRNLFYLTGDSKYGDYIETALYNNGLGSKNPRNTFLTSYFCPLQGHKKWMETTHLNGTPCCSASMARELVRIPEMIWAKGASEAGVAVLLYNEAQFEDTVRDAAGGTARLRMTMETAFPQDGRVRLVVREIEAAAPVPIRLRVPPWAGAFTAEVGGEVISGRPGAMLVIERDWTGGDAIEVSMEIPVRLVDGGASYPGHLAFLRGPQALAADASLNPGLDAIELPADLVGRGTTALEDADPALLPEGWWGRQIYAHPAHGGGRVLLVPYAEAGQMSAEDRFVTWFRVNDGWTEVDDDVFVYEGDGWERQANEEGHYGGAVHATAAAGDAAVLRFEGTGIEVYGCAYNDVYGSRYEPCHIDVFLNGESAGTYRYAESHHRKRLFRLDGLAPGPHEVRIVCQDDNAFIDFARINGRVLGP